MTAPEQRLSDPNFWRQPLADRMGHFADLRAAEPFTEVTHFNPMTETEESFFAVTRYDDVVEISRRAQDFCSGRARCRSPT